LDQLRDDGNRRKAVVTGLEMNGSKKKAVWTGLEMSGSKKKAVVTGSEMNGSRRKAVATGSEMNGSRRKAVVTGSEMNGSRRKAVWTGFEVDGVENGAVGPLAGPPGPPGRDGSARKARVHGQVPCRRTMSSAQPAPCCSPALHSGWVRGSSAILPIHGLREHSHLSRSANASAVLCDCTDGSRSMLVTLFYP